MRHRRRFLSRLVWWLVVCSYFLVRFFLIINFFYIFPEYHVFFFALLLCLLVCFLSIIHLHVRSPSQFPAVFLRRACIRLYFCVPLVLMYIFRCGIASLWPSASGVYEISRDSLGLLWIWVCTLSTFWAYQVACALKSNKFFTNPSHVSIFC